MRITSNKTISFSPIRIVSPFSWSHDTNGEVRSQWSPHVTVAPTLSDLGLTKRESAEAQMLAEMRRGRVLDSSNWIDAFRKRCEIEAIPKYGPISPGTDSRDFRHETLEELVDSLNYLQWSMEKGEISLCQWTLIDEGIRHIIGILLLGEG